MKKILVSFTSALLISSGAVLAQPASELKAEQPKRSTSSTGPMAGTDASQATPSLHVNGMRHFEDLDVDKDGSIGKDEAKRSPSLMKSFSESDENKNGKIDQAEFARSTAAGSPAEATPVTK